LSLKYAMFSPPTDSLRRRRGPRRRRAETYGLRALVPSTRRENCTPLRVIADDLGGGVASSPVTLTGDKPSTTVVPPIDPRLMAELTAAFFLQAADDAQLGSRLALARTTVHIHYTDEVGVTLRLDRTPIEAEPRVVGDVEIEIWGSPESFLDFTFGRRHLAMAVLRGEVEYLGPIRKFLRIVPILRSLDFRIWDELRPATPETSFGSPPSA
jgi:hypothetical protein